MLAECRSEVWADDRCRNTCHLRHARNGVCGDAVIDPPRQRRRGNTELRGNLDLLQATLSDQTLDRHAANFSRAKLAGQERISSGAIQLKGGTLAGSGMPLRSLPRHDLEASNDELRQYQRQLLQHLPAWLKFRQQRQKDLADYLNATEGSVSKWLSGQDMMKVALLWKIAKFLATKPEYLFSPPPANETTRVTVELLDAVQGLDAEEIQRLTELAKLLQRKRTG